MTQYLDTMFKVHYNTNKFNFNPYLIVNENILVQGIY